MILDLFLKMGVQEMSDLTSHNLMYFLDELNLLWSSNKCFFFKIIEITMGYTMFIYSRVSLLCNILLNLNS